MTASYKSIVKIARRNFDVGEYEYESGIIPIADGRDSCYCCSKRFRPGEKVSLFSVPNDCSSSKDRTCHGCDTDLHICESCADRIIEKHKSIVLEDLVGSLRTEMLKAMRDFKKRIQNG